MAVADDVIVTTLDGRKVPKSQIADGEIFINEQGKKVRKVVKKPIADIATGVESGAVTNVSSPDEVDNHIEQNPKQKEHYEELKKEQSLRERLSSRHAFLDRMNIGKSDNKNDKKSAQSPKVNGLPSPVNVDGDVDENVEVDKSVTSLESALISESAENSAGLGGNLAKPVDVTMSSSVSAVAINPNKKDASQSGATLALKGETLATPQQLLATPVNTKKKKKTRKPFNLMWIGVPMLAIYVVVMAVYFISGYNFGDKSVGMGLYGLAVGENAKREYYDGQVFNANEITMNYYYGEGNVKVGNLTKANLVPPTPSMGYRIENGCIYAIWDGEYKDAESRTVTVKFEHEGQFGEVDVTIYKNILVGLDCHSSMSSVSEDGYIRTAVHGVYSNWVLGYGNEENQHYETITQLINPINEKDELNYYLQLSKSEELPVSLEIGDFDKEENCFKWPSDITDLSGWTISAISAQNAEYKCVVYREFDVKFLNISLVDNNTKVKEIPYQEDGEYDFGYTIKGVNTNFASGVDIVRNNTDYVFTVIPKVGYSIKGNVKYLLLNEEKGHTLTKLLEDLNDVVGQDKNETNSKEIYDMINKMVVTPVSKEQDEALKNLLGLNVNNNSVEQLSTEIDNNESVVVEKYAAEEIYQMLMCMFTKCKIDEEEFEKYGEYIIPRSTVSALSITQDLYGDYNLYVICDVTNKYDMIFDFDSEQEDLVYNFVANQTEVSFSAELLTKITTLQKTGAVFDGWAVANSNGVATDVLLVNNFGAIQLVDGYTYEVGEGEFKSIKISYTGNIRLVPKFSAHTFKVVYANKGFSLKDSFGNDIEGKEFTYASAGSSDGSYELFLYGVDGYDDNNIINMKVPDGGTSSYGYTISYVICHDNGDVISYTNVATLPWFPDSYVNGAYKFNMPRSVLKRLPGDENPTVIFSVNINYTVDLNTNGSAIRNKDGFGNNDVFNVGSGNGMNIVGGEWYYVDDQDENGNEIKLSLNKGGVLNFADYVTDEETNKGMIKISKDYYFYGRYFNSCSEVSPKIKWRYKNSNSDWMLADLTKKSEDASGKYYTLNLENVTDNIELSLDGLITNITYTLTVDPAANSEDGTPGLKLYDENGDEINLNKKFVYGENLTFKLDPAIKNLDECTILVYRGKELDKRPLLPIGDVYIIENIQTNIMIIVQFNIVKEIEPPSGATLDQTAFSVFVNGQVVVDVPSGEHFVFTVDDIDKTDNYTISKVEYKIGESGEYEELKEATHEIGINEVTGYMVPNGMLTGTLYIKVTFVDNSASA